MPLVVSTAPSPRVIHFVSRRHTCGILPHGVYPKGLSRGAPTTRKRAKISTDLAVAWALLLPKQFNFYIQTKGASMLRWALIFLVVALIAAIFGFGGIAGAAAGIAKFIFFAFIVVAAIVFLMTLVGGSSRSLR